MCVEASLSFPVPLLLCHVCIVKHLLLSIERGRLGDIEAHRGRTMGNLEFPMTQNAKTRNAGAIPLRVLYYNSSRLCSAIPIISASTTKRQPFDFKSIYWAVEKHDKVPLLCTVSESTYRLSVIIFVVKRLRDEGYSTHYISGLPLRAI
jgi:hypothetical protein